MSARTPDTSFVVGRAITPALVDAWRDLSRRAAEPNPFAEPEVVLPAVRHLAGHARVGLLTVRDRDRLLGLLPVSWPLAVPIGRRHVPVPLLQAWVEPYQVLGTPLIDADRPVEAMVGLLRPPASLPAPALVLRYFGEKGSVAAALDEALARRGQRAVRLKTYERALLLRDGAPPPSRNRRNRYNRLRRRRETMAEALGPVRVVDRAGDPAAVEEFLVLESLGWKGAAGTALASDPRHAAWFREVCDGLRAAGRLEVLSLEVGTRPAAMWVNFASGEGSVHFKSAYDESLGEHRPGEQLLVHCVETAPAGRYAWLDSATVPDNTLFNQLWPSRKPMSTLVAPLHGAVGSAAVAAARAVASLRARRRASGG